MDVGKAGISESFWTGMKGGKTVASPTSLTPDGRRSEEPSESGRPDCGSVSVGDADDCRETDCCSSLPGFVSRADLDQEEREREESQAESKVIRGFTAGGGKPEFSPRILSSPFSEEVTKFPAAGEGERTSEGDRGERARKEKGTFGRLGIGFLKRLPELLNEPVEYYFCLSKQGLGTRQRFYYLWLNSFII